jgi:hypothetical protein
MNKHNTTKQLNMPPRRKRTTRVQREDGTWEFIDTTNTQITERRFDALADADADANANEDATADANADNKLVEKEKQKDIIAPHDDTTQEKTTDASEDTTPKDDEMCNEDANGEEAAKKNDNGPRNNKCAKRDIANKNNNGPRNNQLAKGDISSPGEGEGLQQGGASDASATMKHTTADSSSKGSSKDRRSRKEAAKGDISSPVEGEELQRVCKNERHHRKFIQQGLFKRST